MDIILYFFRDNITGIHYLMYAFVCQFLMFALIGYLYKQKYGKLEIKLSTNKEFPNNKVENVTTNNQQVKPEKTIAITQIQELKTIKPIVNQSVNTNTNINTNANVNTNGNTNGNVNINQNIGANQVPNMQTNNINSVNNQVNLSNQPIPEVKTNIEKL